jgi:hypothetical protein
VLTDTVADAASTGAGQITLGFIITAAFAAIGWAARLYVKATTDQITDLRTRVATAEERASAAEKAKAELEREFRAAIERIVPLLSDTARLNTTAWDRIRQMGGPTP